MATAGKRAAARKHEEMKRPETGRAASDPFPYGDMPADGPLLGREAAVQYNEGSPHDRASSDSFESRCVSHLEKLVEDKRGSRTFTVVTTCGELSATASADNYDTAKFFSQRALRRILLARDAGGSIL